MLQILLFWKHVFDFHSKGSDANPINWEEATFEIDSDLSLAAGFHNGKWWQLGFHWSQLSHHTWTSRFCLDFTGLWWIMMVFTSICSVGLDFFRFDGFGSSNSTDPFSTRSSWSQAKLLINYRCEYDGLIWIYYYYWSQLASGKTAPHGSIWHQPGHT